ncbi:BAR domain-containing protein [Coemansia sp. RSA 552]|nr:BAR domain-containing protein [Coemansia sp. RSA 552]
MDGFSNFTKNVSEGWTPFASRVGSSFTQYRQMANERLGSAEVTPLPNDYSALGQRFDSVVAAMQVLERLGRAYTAGPTRLDAQAIQAQLAALTSRADGAEKPSWQHEMARASLDSAERVGLEEPLGAALFKVGSIEEKVGAQKMEQDEAVTTRFSGALATALAGGVALAQGARKDVNTARLQLDAAKAGFRNAKPQHADAARREVESCEDRFVTAVEQAMKLMRAVVESPEPLRALSALIEAQHKFHHEAAQLLGDLAPEIAEMQATQEALYRNE